MIAASVEPYLPTASVFGLIPESPTQASLKGKQMPVLPKTKESLPDGVESIEEWGETWCDLPKVAAMKISYAGLVEKAHSGQSMSDYLDRMLTFPKGKSAKVDDLKAYLQAIQYTKPKSTKVFPGSDIRRLKASEI